MEKPGSSIERAAELVASWHTNLPSLQSTTAARPQRKLMSSRFRSFKARKRSSLLLSALPITTHVPNLKRTNELFKKPYPVSIFLSTSNDLGWYHSWLHGEIKNLSVAIRQLQAGGEELLQNNVFERIFTEVATFVQDNGAVCIDDVVDHLRKTQKMETSDDALQTQRLLVFAILGWQSMLYRAAFNICSRDEFAVHEDSEQPGSGLVFDNSKVSADLADRPLFIILKGFGNLLPSPPTNLAQVASENSKAAGSWLPLNPAETNAYLLAALLHVRIRWVDSLALHLDYNKSNRTLSLFRYPSFCVAMLQSKGPIFSFASTEKKSFDPRASEADISQFMREILLSFRLLFGQHGPSRRLFPHIYGPMERLQEPDQLLAVLCMTKYIKHSSEMLSLSPDQPIYFAAQYFPVLSERIELIAKELKNSRPTSISELLHDRRDTLQYWTFWLVSIIGGASIVLSLVQVILQAI